MGEDVQKSGPIRRSHILSPLNPPEWWQEQCVAIQDPLGRSDFLWTQYLLLEMRVIEYGDPSVVFFLPKQLKEELEESLRLINEKNKPDPM